jgi:hypothetical protein
VHRQDRMGTPRPFTIVCVAWQREISRCGTSCMRSTEPVFDRCLSSQLSSKGFFPLPVAETMCPIHQAIFGTRPNPTSWLHLGFSPRSQSAVSPILVWADWLGVRSYCKRALTYSLTKWATARFSCKSGLNELLLTARNWKTFWRG